MSERNVDVEEIARFDALAQEWWDPDGPMRPLHAINPVRLQFIAERARLAGMSVLDVGCGGGLLAEDLARQRARVLGIDLSREAIAVAAAHARSAGLEIEYREQDVDALAQERPGQFDVVTCMELLEHVPDPGALIASCARLVRPGGDLFFSTINRNLKAYALAVVAAEYLLQLLPRGTHDYARFIRPSELDAWARPHGLRVAALAGLRYDLLARRWSLGGGVDVNYLAHYRAAPAAEQP